MAKVQVQHPTETSCPAAFRRIYPNFHCQQQKKRTISRIYILSAVNTSSRFRKETLLVPRLKNGSNDTIWTDYFFGVLVWLIVEDEKAQPVVPLKHHDGV